MNTTHFNCLRLNLCQESQKPRILSRDFSQPIRNGSDTDKQTDVPLTEGTYPVGVWTLKIKRKTKIVIISLYLFKLFEYYFCVGIVGTLNDYLESKSPLENANIIPLA